MVEAIRELVEGFTDFSDLLGFGWLHSRFEVPFTHSAGCVGEFLDGSDETGTKSVGD